MTTRRARKQLERIKKIRSKVAGRFVVHQAKSGRAKSARARLGKYVIVGSSGRAVQGAKAYVDRTPVDEVVISTREQPKPKLPLLSGSKDPTLAERFEEELYRS